MRGIGRRSRSRESSAPPQRDPARLLSVLLSVFLVSLHAKGPDPAELRAHIATLASGVVDIGLLSDVPRGKRREAFDKVPERTKADVASDLYPRCASPARAASQTPPVAGRTRCVIARRLPGQIAGCRGPLRTREGWGRPPLRRLGEAPAQSDAREVGGVSWVSVVPDVLVARGAGGCGGLGG